MIDDLQVLRGLLEQRKAFEKHQGRPGKVGGSLPKGQTHGEIVKAPMNALAGVGSIEDQIKILPAVDKKVEDQIKILGVSGPLTLGDLRKMSRDKSTKGYPLVQAMKKYMADNAIDTGPQGMDVKPTGAAQSENMRGFNCEGVRIWYTDKTSKNAITALAEIVTAYHGLPEHFAKATTDVYFMEQRNKDDEYWEKEYKIPNFKSLACGGDGTIEVWGRQSIDYGVLAHEMAHNFARQRYGLDASKRIKVGKDFKRAIKDDANDPSEYAALAKQGDGTLTEDFAESFRLIFSTGKEATNFKKNCPARYAVVKKLLEEPKYAG